MDDPEILGEFVEESREHLADIEVQLLQIEALGKDFNDALVNNVFRAIHSIKGAAGFLGLTQINDVAHRLENVLGRVREHDLIPDAYNVDVMLKAADRLRKLIESITTSNDTDNSELIARLDKILCDDMSYRVPASAPTAAPAPIPEPSPEPVDSAPTPDAEPELEATAEIQAKPKAKAKATSKATPKAATKGTTKSTSKAATKGTPKDPAKGPAKGPAKSKRTSPIAKCESDLSQRTDAGNSNAARRPKGGAGASNSKPVSDFELPPVADTGARATIQLDIAESGVSLAQSLENEKPVAAQPAKAQLPKASSTQTSAKPAPTAKPSASPKPASESSAAASKPGKRGAVVEVPPSTPVLTTEPTIRVGVRVLDRLMNLAGELVLSRNQLLQSLSLDVGRSATLDTIVGGLDHVTTELQETIMQTRMQPIGNVFNKFPRVIRDLSSSLGKQISLRMEGSEVEVDKTIVEAIADPLTHLIRNSCDHGIEMPDVRVAAGKPECGEISLRAFHQAGKVMIEIIDNGAGMDPNKLRRKAVEKGLLTESVASHMNDRDAVNLIFAPGFSTADSITAVSGRGVGMDVVRTNIEKLGGSVEVTSEFGMGSTISITLPLTLAIVPSMIVAVGDRRYALPQTNIAELVRTDGADKRIEMVSSSEVLRLRGALLPLIRLRDALGMPREVERLSKESQLVVVEAGRSRFALAVDRVLDCEEIVIKPLGSHLTNLPLLAGATILGDGRVAMILDAAGIASRMHLHSEAEAANAVDVEGESHDHLDEKLRFVLMSNSPQDHFAISMDIISRIERIEVSEIERVGERRVLKYRGGTLPLIAIDDVVTVTHTDETDHVYVLVFKVFGHEVGLMAPHLNDIRDCSIASSVETSRQSGVAGIMVIDGVATRILDLYGICESARPDWFEKSALAASVREPARLLVCEDSAFFRNFVVRTLEEQGYTIQAADDGEEGWEMLNDPESDFDMLVTDIEMPRLDGFGLTQRVRADERLRDLPIIALTSLADQESIERGRSAGVNDYQIKMNKPELLAAIERHIHVGVRS